MLDPDNVPAIAADEMLARYICAGQSTKSLRKLVRPNMEVRMQLFMPYPHIETSVNRHRDCTEDEIWEFGQGVAKLRKLTLHGRSDISARDCSEDPLSVLAKPIKDAPVGAPDNPNHADIVGYPVTKEDQKSLAEKLAAAAGDCQPPPA